MNSALPTTQEIAPGELPLPLEVEQLDQQWFAQAFGNAGFGRVTGAHTKRVIWGTATKVLVQVDTEGLDGRRRSIDVCVKGPFDAALREYYDLGIMFVGEAAFYRDVAPQLDVAIPRCHYAVEDGDYGVVVLEDLVTDGCTFAAPEKAASLDQAAGVLDVFAGVQAKTYGWRPGHFPWLQKGSISARVGVLAMGEGDRFKELCARPFVASVIPPAYHDGGRVMAALQRLWSKDDDHADLVLGHGDAHYGQVYFKADGTAGLLDWQSIGLMPVMKDVAYFLGGALSIDDRRRHERDLIAKFIEDLARLGGPRIAFDDAFIEYRAQMLQGMVWAMVTEQMQPLEVITAFNERYGAALSDLGALELVEA